MKPFFTLLISVFLFASGPARAEAQAPELVHFPYDVIEVEGTVALDEWEKLRQRPGTTPIIIGGAEDAERLAYPFDPDDKYGEDPDVSLGKAEGLEHPRSLADLRAEQRAEMAEWARKNGVEEIAAYFEQEQIDPELIGTWPEDVSPNNGLLSLYDYSTGKVFETVYIALLPTDDPSEAPALLQFGGWNANPSPEYHVAAFRSWADRYGAVPVLITGDVIEFHVTSPPETRDAAMALAHEQYSYSEDIVLQGVGTVSALGATLKVSEWWYFWWD